MVGGTLRYLNFKEARYICPYICTAIDIQRECIDSIVTLIHLLYPHYRRRPWSTYSTGVDVSRYFGVFCRHRRAMHCW